MVVVLENSKPFKPFAQSNYTESNDITRTATIDQPLHNNNNVTPSIALLQLKQKLADAPHDDKSYLVYAQQTTDLITDDHLMGFLHVENFDIDRALTRLLKYWKQRHKIFGDKYTLPITLYGAMQGYIDMLQQGFLMLMPVLDDLGRAIIVGNATNFDEVCRQCPEAAQVFWYLVHVAMENPSVRKNGFVMVSNDKDVELHHFDASIMVPILRSARYFPIKWQGLHSCNLKIFPIIAKGVQAMLSLSQRQIFMIHNGSTEQVLESLAACSISKRCIPVEMGGQVPITLNAFVKARLFLEGDSSDNDMLNIPTSSDSNDLSASPHPSSDDPRVMAYTQYDSVSSSNYAAGNANTSPNQVNKKMKYSRVGRKGDKRMNQALEARKKNPELSLLAALLAGGFIFPQLYAPRVKMADVLDVDGVSVYQRKNQLNRRLREDKKKNQKT